MVLLILERCSDSLLGELTRWLMEVKPGVFLGTVSALVRDELWDLAKSRLGRNGGCVLVHSAATEQGFSMRAKGVLTRTPVEVEGLWLMRRAVEDHPSVSRNPPILGNLGDEKA
jgi:CRISPR-associated protein Cas2